MDDLAVTRGGAAANVRLGLRHDDFMASKRSFARDGQPDDAGSDDEHLHG
jgi:hypothetical protein